MAHRRFEKFQYRQVLVSLRQGDTDRDVARARLMGRRKVAVLRALAIERGLLEPAAPLPQDAEIAAALGSAKRTASTLQPRALPGARRALGGAGGFGGGDPRRSSPQPRLAPH